jgi:hypothetical protein
MQRLFLVALSVLVLGLAACANMSTKQQRMLSGGAIGAAGGGVLSGITGGSVVGGAVVGGAVGTGLGYLYDRNERH